MGDGVDGAGVATDRTFDANNSLLSETTSRSVNGVPQRVTTTYVYDTHDRVTSITDGEGQVIRFTYTPTGQKATEIDPLTPGGSVQFGDPIGEADTIYTLHSELASFGRSFGCAQASFRLSLAPALDVPEVPVATAYKEEAPWTRARPAEGQPAMR